MHISIQPEGSCQQKRIFFIEKVIFYAHKFLHMEFFGRQIKKKGCIPSASF